MAWAAPHSSQVMLRWGCPAFPCQGTLDLNRSGVLVFVPTDVNSLVQH